MNWLDTETKAILRKESDPKLAPPTLAEFGLVLLQRGNNLERLVRAIRRIKKCARSEVLEIVPKPLPITLGSRMTEEEALSGQFELICCDAPSAYLRSEVLEQGNLNYRHNLLRQILQSTEFKPTKIDVLEVPETESGERFIDQFLGPEWWGRKTTEGPWSLTVPCQKARLMKQWAELMGVVVRCKSLFPQDDHGPAFGAGDA